MADTSSNNVTDLFPVAPEALTEAEYEFALNALVSHANKVSPLAALSDEPDAWQLFVRMAETDPSGLGRAELKMQAAMMACATKGEARGFSLQRFRVEAKQNKKARDERAKMITKRVRENAKLTTSGRPNEAAQGAMGLPTEAQADALSQSPTLISIAWLAAQRRGRLWFDEFSNNVFTDWDGSLDDKVIEVQPVDDRWRLNTYFTLMRSDIRLAKLAEKASENAINQFAFSDTRNAPRDWLRGLVWDKQPRLATWISHVYGTPQDAYHEAVGRCWLIGIVARIYRKGDKMDNMPVLIGAEGTRKTTSLEILGGKLSQGQKGRHYYGTINVSAEKMTDFLMTLNGLMVAEIAELDALMNKRTEHGRVKTIITTTEDLFRAPYGRSPSIHLRSCVLAGTTNEFHWNNFEGIGRRFWPFEVTKIAETDWLIANRDQLFAEAHEAYKDGVAWHYVPLEGHQRQIKEHRIDDPQQDLIERWLQDTRFYDGKIATKPSGGDTNATDEWSHWGNLITTSRIMIQALGVSRDRVSQGVARKVASVMRNLGWKSHVVRLGSGRDTPIARCWIREDSEASKQGQLFDGIEE